MIVKMDGDDRYATNFLISKSFFFSCLVLQTKKRFVVVQFSSFVIKYLIHFLSLSKLICNCNTNFLSTQNLQKWNVNGIKVGSKKKLFFVCCLELTFYEFFMNFHFPFVNILFARSYEKLKKYSLRFYDVCGEFKKKCHNTTVNFISSNEKVCWHFNPSGKKNSCKWQRCQQL